MDELADRINHRKYLEEQERQAASASSQDEFGYMDINELRNQCRFMSREIERMQKEKEDERLRNEKQIAMMQEILDMQRKADENRKQDGEDTRKQIEALTSQVSSLTSQLAEKDAIISSKDKNLNEMSRQIKKLTDRLDVMNQERFGSTSLSGIDRNYSVRGKNDGKDDFDGTPESLPADDINDDTDDDGVEGGGLASCTDTEVPQSQGCTRPNRKGMKYNKPVVDNTIIHLSDRTKLPEGAKIISSHFVSIKDLVLHIANHDFEVLRVKDANGEIINLYLPFDGEDGTDVYDKVVPHTHVTADFLSFIVQDRYDMCVPAYREAHNRLYELGYATCRQNLINWGIVGSEILKLLIPALKDAALHEGANINVDETWCRYQTGKMKRKTYMWAMINRKARIVIYFYEDCIDEDGQHRSGGRSRKVIKEFIGDADIQSLQSDGYNVYMYIENELLDIDHLCCMAHTWRKLKVAYNQGCELAKPFLDDISFFYRREDLYKELGLSSDEIKERRNDKEMNDTVSRMQARMFDLLATSETTMSDLMRNALNYLHKFWKQLFKYRENGDYCIDNNSIEQQMRTVANQRKNCQAFHSVKGATASAVYNTFVATCKQIGVPFRRYFGEVVMAIKAGRTDYENLLPHTIGL